MYAEKQSIRCDSCGKGQIVKHFEDISFRQWSDGGHVHCRATVAVSVCENCGAGSLEPGADKIIDEVFRREYDKHVADWHCVIRQTDPGAESLGQRALACHAVADAA
jgi:hypothetical protein